MVGGLSQTATILGGVGSGLLLVTLWVWRVTRNLRSKFSDEFDETRSYYWSQFSGDLTQLVLEIFGEIDQEGDEATDLEVQTISVIENEIDRSELEVIEESLRDFDRPLNLLDTVKEEYGRAWKSFGMCTIGCSVLALTVTVPNPGQSTGGFEAVVGVATVVVFMRAISSLKNGWESEQRLDELINEYKREY